MDAHDARVVIKELARQDTAGETHDSYALTGDAVDAMRRWRDVASEAGDLGVCQAIDYLGMRKAAAVYAAHRDGVIK